MIGPFARKPASRERLLVTFWVGVAVVVFLVWRGVSDVLHGRDAGGLAIAGVTAVLLVPAWRRAYGSPSEEQQR